MTSVLLTFNEILNKGFDGYNFMAGLNNHLRDLLVSRDEATVKLLETSPSIRQRYREQAVRAPLSFIYDALDIGSQCMLTFKSEQEPASACRACPDAHVQLGGERGSEESKKKVEQQPVDADIPLKQSLSSAASPASQPASETQTRVETTQKKASPGDGIAKKISIKNIVSESRTGVSSVSEPEAPVIREPAANDFTAEELHNAWNSFAAAIKEESPRIAVTLSAVTPELLPDKTVILRLDNSALKESFDHNFKARLENHLRDTLVNSSLKLQTTVEATERGDILYSVDQKFNHLASKNPALRELKKTFNLDFE